MKKTFFTASLALLIATNCFSQSAEKKDYLQKSKNQKITAWTLFGIGAVINIVGVTKVEEPNNSAVTCWIAGSVLMFASIPFTIAAHKNKKKAMSLSFKNEMIQQLTGNNNAYKPVPSLALKIKL